MVDPCDWKMYNENIILSLMWSEGQFYGYLIKGGRMGRSNKVSLWCVSLLINTRFRFFILE